jgi:hypothetical protein
MSAGGGASAEPVVVGRKSARGENDHALLTIVVTSIFFHVAAFQPENDDQPTRANPSERTLNCFHNYP